MKGLDELQKILDEKVNVLLAQHKGRVDIKARYPANGVVTIEMSGGCQGCAGAKATMKSIVLTTLREADEDIVEILDVTNHKEDANAFFKVEDKKDGQEDPS